LSNEFKFATKQADNRGRLIDFGFRWYDREVGRWTQRDPLGVAGGLNLYTYCNANPPNLVDPWGLQWWGGRRDEQGCPGWTKMGQLVDEEGNVYTVYQDQHGDIHIQVSFPGTAIQQPGTFTLHVQAGTADYHVSAAGFEPKQRYEPPDKKVVEAHVRIAIAGAGAGAVTGGIEVMKIGVEYIQCGGPYMKMGGAAVVTVGSVMTAVGAGLVYLAGAGWIW